MIFSKIRMCLVQIYYEMKVSHEKPEIKNHTVLLRPDLPEPD